jgi:hypothetical protein
MRDISGSLELSREKEGWSWVLVTLLMKFRVPWRIDNSITSKTYISFSNKAFFTELLRKLHLYSYITFFHVYIYCILLCGLKEKAAAPV